MSVLPISVPPQAGVDWLDKAAHLCEYLLLAWLAGRAAREGGPMPFQRFVVIGVAVASYGALLEGLQLFLPYRSAEWWDVVANAAGSGVGAWLGKGNR